MIFFTIELHLLRRFYNFSYFSCFHVILESEASLSWLIFTLQIDSVMSTRLANENDASRRLKSEFLIQFDGVSSNPDDLVIVIGQHLYLFV